MSKSHFCAELGFTSVRVIASFVAICIGLDAMAELTRPNIVLIVADDLGCGAGGYGDPGVRTPHLDALADRSTRFAHAYATVSSCSASRSVLLTGKHNHATGQYGLNHAAHHFTSLNGVESLPGLLNRRGYHTACVGKLHVGPPQVYPFDEVIASNPRRPELMVSDAESVIDRAKSGPFFLLFAPVDPHRSGQTAGDSDYAPNLFGNPPLTGRARSEVHYAPGSIKTPPFLPDTPQCRAELAQHYQSISRLDRGVGLLLELLERKGIAGTTIVFFTSDNGPPFPGAKTSLYEPGIRMPLVVYDPTGPAQVRERALVSLLDIAPTILDYADGKPSKQGLFHGRSFRALVASQDGDEGEWDTVTASHSFHEVTMYYPMRLLRRGNLKLIWNIASELTFPTASDLYTSATWKERLKVGDAATYGQKSVKSLLQRPRWELYDLAADPHETRNLADDPAYANKFADLQDELKQFQEATSDPWAHKWKYE